MANEIDDSLVVDDDENGSGNVVPFIPPDDPDPSGEDERTEENVLTYITAVSQITPEICAQYIRVDPDEDPDALDELGTMLTVAKAYVKKYTGVSDLDESADFVLCVLILVQDQWDNRTLYIEKGSLNRTVESILDLHSVNLL